VQVYGDNAMKKTAVYKWVKRFSEGRESVTDEERSGRPATEENITKVRQTLRENRRLTVRSMAEQVNRKTVRKILTKYLDMRMCVQKRSQRSSPKNKSKEESQFSKTFRRGNMTFWAVSSELMKHVSTNATLKRSSKVYNGRVTIPHDQKNSVGPKQRVKTILLTFF